MGIGRFDGGPIRRRQYARHENSIGFPVICLHGSLRSASCCRRLRLLPWRHRISCDEIDWTDPSMTKLRCRVFPFLLRVACPRRYGEDRAPAAKIRKARRTDLRGQDPAASWHERLLWRSHIAATGLTAKVRYRPRAADAASTESGLLAVVLVACCPFPASSRIGPDQQS